MKHKKAGAMGDKDRSKKTSPATAVSRKLAHDLNSPITALKLSTQALKQDPEIIKKHSAILDLAEQAIARLEKMSQDIRAMNLKVEDDSSEIHVSIEAGLSSFVEPLHGLGARIERTYLAEPIFVKASKIKVVSLISQRMNHAIQTIKPKGLLRITVQLSYDRAIANVDISVDGVSLESVEFEVADKVESSTQLADFGVKEISIFENQKLVVIEDSEFIAKYWEKIATENQLMSGIYARWEDYQEQLVANSNEPFECVYIVDLNFDNSTLSGFEIVEKLKTINPKADIYVCSGDLWDSAVRDELKRFDVKLLSKPLPNDIKIVVNSSSVQTQS